MNFIPLIIIAIPFALGAWLWWIMRKIGGKRTAYSSRKAQRPPQTFGKIPAETTHKDYTDPTPQQVVKRAQATTLVDRVEPPPRDIYKPTNPPEHFAKITEPLSRDKGGELVLHQCGKPIESTTPNPVEHPVGDIAHVQEHIEASFIKGERYLWGDNRVMECMGFRGKKERRVGFEDYGLLEYFPKKREQDADLYQWFGIRVDNGVEVCDRGRLRADKIATRQQAGDYAAIRKDIEDGERAYWAERKAKRERDAKRLEELEKIVKEHNLE